MYDDVMTRNDDGELAVRTVSATEGTNPSSYDDVFTRDSNGKLALRVVGSGGGDSHNKGYFATQAALEEAYPTAEAGDYAIVGSTDTVWLWDEDTSAWVDSDQKGQVTSVNGQTGAVTVSEVPSQTGYSGRVLGTDGFVAGWVVPEKVQRSTMPQASSEEVGNIYQYVGTTDANYTNGYFYKCVSDGQDPATYSWTRVDVQPAGATYTAGNGINIDSNNEISVAAPTLVNKASVTNGLIIDNSYVQVTNYNASVSVGYSNTLGAAQGVIVGASSSTTGSGGVALGYNTKAGAYGVAIGRMARANANYAIQLGGDNATNNNPDPNTFKVGNQNGNYEIMSADGTIPADRLTHAINKYSTMPTAASTNEGWIVQFTGTTDSTYTHGHLYECVSDGADPATYSWTEVSMGGASYTAGTGIDITSGVISVTAPTLTNIATQSGSLVVGSNAQSLLVDTTAYGANSIGFGRYGVAFGKSAVAKYKATALGANSTANDYTIQLGQGGTNSDAGTMKVALTTNSDVTTNYELLSADGTIPEARLADTTNAQQGDVLTLDSTGNAIWAAPSGGGMSSISVTLPAASWSSSTQTVTATGVTASNTVIIGAAPASTAEYNTCGVICTAQGTDSLTFTCTSTPTNDLTVTVLILA